MARQTYLSADDREARTNDPRQIRPHDNDDGGALLAVMMFGMLASLVVLGLVGRLVVEGREVANSLAQVRAYWAAMGVNSYVLSRTAQAGWCTSPCDGATVASNVQAYANELNDLKYWRYLDVSSNYAFTLAPTMTTPSTATPTIQIRTQFQWNGSVPVISNMTSTRPIELQFGPKGAIDWGSAMQGNGALMSITSLTRPSS